MVVVVVSLPSQVIFVPLAHKGNSDLSPFSLSLSVSLFLVITIDKAKRFGKSLSNTIKGRVDHLRWGVTDTNRR